MNEVKKSGLDKTTVKDNEKYIADRAAKFGTKAVKDLENIGKNSGKISDRARYGHGNFSSRCY